MTVTSAFTVTATGDCDSDWHRDCDSITLCCSGNTQRSHAKRSFATEVAASARHLIMPSLSLLLSPPQPMPTSLSTRTSCWPSATRSPMEIRHRIASLSLSLPLSLSAQQTRSTAFLHTFAEVSAFSPASPSPFSHPHPQLRVVKTSAKIWTIALGQFKWQSDSQEVPLPPCPSQLLFGPPFGQPLEAMLVSQLLSANKRNEPKGRCSCEADGSFGIIMSGGCNELPTLGKHLLDIEEIMIKTGLILEI